MIGNQKRSAKLYACGLFGVFLTILALSCGDHSTSDVQEAPDSKNGIRRFDLLAMPLYDDIAAIKDVFTTKVPWSDVYWPYTQVGMARRWGEISKEPSSLGLSSFWQDQLDNLPIATLNPLLSPAEKYDTLFRLRWTQSFNVRKLKEEIEALKWLELAYPLATDLESRRAIVGELARTFAQSKELSTWSPMAADGWSRWLSYNKNPRYQFRQEKDTGDKWDWMGYCHGWAPAALMHEAPKHAVLAKIGGKEILFTEGDLRGLLTKTWADHAPGNEQQFIGRRCNENTEEPEGPIPASDDGRGVSGFFISPSGSTRTFTMLDEYMTGGIGMGRRIYHITIHSDSSATSTPAYLVERTLNGKLIYYIGDNLPDMKGFAERGDTSGLTHISSVKFYGCWDVNPASFHTLLTEYLGKKNRGFVMDRTRTGQVWNQPIYGARFKVGPLLDAALVDDRLFRYRAPGTAYLALVNTTVLWSSEPAKPSLDYADNFDRSRIMTLKYTYTLEFDENRQLIGGEWGDFVETDPKAIIPDFLFTYPETAEPRDALESGFDYTGLVKPLYRCSQESSEEKIKTMSVNGQEMRYTDCEIQKAKVATPQRE